jgi:hypothetical protein
MLQHPTSICSRGNSILILYYLSGNSLVATSLQIPFLLTLFLTMSEVDYGYGEPEPDYGYGDEAPAATDYGYGDDAGGGGEDYGYGDAAPGGGEDYGYGDAAPGGTDYGYGDDEPTPLPKAAGRPKRRCSVTKFSLDSGPPPAEEAPPEAAPDYDKDTEATASCNVSTDGDEAGEEGDMVSAVLDRKNKGGKKTMMSKIRKRMSLAF